RRVADAARSADPAPAVAAGGRVFAAPADADRVFALDAETGQLLWESGPVEGAQILGISRGRVVVTTTGPVRGIRALGVVTGSYREPDGWIQHDGGGLLGYGRGLVTDDVIVWPSRGGLYFLDPDTGRPYHAPLRTTLPGPQEWLFGNVAYADGVLVVVTPTQVWGYVADAPPFVRPPDPEPRARFEAMIDQAERDLAGGDLRAARETLLGVARGDLPAAWRAWAAARLLLLAPPTDDTVKLPRDVRDVLIPELLGEWLVTADGELVSLATLADRHAGRMAPPGGLPAPPTLTADRKPPDAPGLGPDARIAATAQLPPNAFPLRPIAGAVTPPRNVFAATARVLVAVPFDQSDTTTHPAADVFTHAADIPDGFVAAGPFAVAVYGGGRDPVWVFRVPDTDPLPGRVPRPAVRTGESRPPPHLSSFVLAGEWLLTRLGEHHLLALDLKGRRVVWVLGAHGRPRFEPVLFPTAPRFEPYFYVGGRLVVVQLSDGRRWMIQITTGRVWDDAGTTFEKAVPAGYGEKTARVPWAHPPVEIAGNRIAFSDGPGLVRVDKVVAGRFVKWWVYEADGESSLAGDPPQVRGWEEVVLVAVRRNHGVELDRPDATDGRSMWTGGPVFLDASRVDLGAADADPLRVFVPAGGKLFALALDDGKVVWEAALPDAAGGWVVRAGRKVIIVYPAEAVPAEPVGGVWDRAVTSFLRCPLGWRLPWLAVALYDAWADRTVPVLLFDPESGKLLKKLTVPARGPGVTAWFEADRAVVATGARVTWLR
ncbi:MAG: outer rane biosis protein BamB, partial [Gemmataceae bacterium]|nr:outer rane biosis protein BamB [Gemmataceae bacterium]